MNYRVDIPEVNLNARFDDRLNIVQYFGFFRKEEIDKESGRLLMLDVDFGRKCSLRCPTCFRRSNPVDDFGVEDLTYDELIKTIFKAKKLGLREIKICGAGEPLENPDLLKFAKQLTEWNIGLSIFTKGHILGDDNLAANIFKNDGISNSKDLATALFKLKTSILLSFQSFDSEIQNKIVGKISDYTLRRNRAAELLAEVGFNKTLPTRMAFCILPIMRETYNELFDIYVFCRKRNIFPLIAPLMVSGKQFSNKFLSDSDVSNKEKISLYMKVYQYNIENGIQSFDRILKEGISPMAGVHPCNQIAAGLYITSNGNVLNCPGDSINILGNVRNKDIQEIWKNSDNFRRRGTFNCKCPPKDGKTIPKNFYSEILNNIKQIYSNKSIFSLMHA